MTQAMKLHALRIKTIDSYRRTLFRVAGHFSRCPDDLKPDELKEYFSTMLEQYSWSTIKVDLSSLQFFHRYALEREMEWVKIIRPPRVRTLPDIPTREEVQLLINTVRKLRYRIFLLVVYSLGLRIRECLTLEVADIDGRLRRVHIRDGKGGKDRYVPLPAVTLQAMRRFWSSHRHPRLLLPSPAGHQFIVRIASAPMDASGVQAALRAGLWHPEKTDGPQPAPCLRHPPTGVGDGPEADPVTARPQQQQHHSPLCPHHPGGAGSQQ